MKGNVIAIGWRDFGDPSAEEPTREAFKDKYAATHPDANKGSIPTSSGMLFRFCHEVQIGSLYTEDLKPMISAILPPSACDDAAGRRLLNLVDPLSLIRYN